MKLDDPQQVDRLVGVLERVFANHRDGIGTTAKNSRKMVLKHGISVPDAFTRERIARPDIEITAGMKIEFPEVDGERSARRAVVTDNKKNGWILQVFPQDVPGRPPIIVEAFPKAPKTRP